MSVWIRQQIGPFTLLYEIDTLRYEMKFPKNCSRAFMIVRQAPMLAGWVAVARRFNREKCRKKWSPPQGTTETQSSMPDFTKG